MTLRELVVERVKSTVPTLKEVAGAARLDDILNGLIVAPSAHIYRLNNQSSDNELLSAVSQYVPQQLAVVVSTRNFNKTRAADSSDENEYFCQLIQSQLLGWEPEQKYSALEYVSGSLVVFKKGLFIWREVYSSGSHIRSIL